MKKALLFILTVVVLIIVVFSITKNAIVKSAIIKGIKNSTGLLAQIESVNVGLIGGSIDIKGFHLNNPEGFEGVSMAKVSRLHIDSNLAALSKKKIHLEKAILEIEEVFIIKNKQGKLNVDTIKQALRPHQPEEKDPVKAEPAEKKEEAKKEEVKKELPQVAIDSLSFKLGKITYSDHSTAGKPSIMEIKLNIDEHYENVASLEDLLEMVMERSFLVGIAGVFGGIDGNIFKGQSKQMEKQFKSIGKELEKQFKADFNNDEGGIKSEVDKLQDSFKGIFKTD